MERENRKEFDIYFVIHYLDLLTIFLRIDITKYFQFVDMILKRNAQNRSLHFSAENVDNSAALRGSASPHCSWPRNLSLDISIVFGCWTLAAPATARQSDCELQTCCRPPPGPVFHRQLRLTTFVIFDVTQPSPTSGQPQENRGRGIIMVIFCCAK